MSKEAKEKKSAGSIAHMKLAQAIKVGTTEEFFINGAHFDIQMEDSVLIKVTHKRSGDVTYTTIFNVIYLKRE